jgi:hypothetical protein
MYSEPLGQLIDPLLLMLSCVMVQTHSSGLSNWASCHCHNFIEQSHFVECVNDSMFLVAPEPKERRWFLQLGTFSSSLLLCNGVGLINRPAPGVYTASNRNEYQKHKNNVSGE